MNRWVKSTKNFLQLYNYIEHFLLLGSTITGCVSISAFSSIIGISIWITIPAIWLKICAITTGIQKCKLRIKKKKENYKIVLFAKSKLNSTEVLISKALIYLVISHDEFV